MCERETCSITQGRSMKDKRSFEQQAVAVEFFGGDLKKQILAGLLRMNTIGGKSCS